MSLWLRRKLQPPANTDNARTALSPT